MIIFMAGSRWCLSVRMCVTSTCSSSVDFTTRKALNLMLSRYAPGNVTENFTVGIFILCQFLGSRFFFLPFVQCSGRLLFRNPFFFLVNALLVYFIIPARYFSAYERLHNSFSKKKKNLLIYLLFASFLVS